MKGGDDKKKGTVETLDKAATWTVTGSKLHVIQHGLRRSKKKKREKERPVDKKGDNSLAFG